VSVVFVGSGLISYAHQSPYPHLTWLTQWLVVDAPRVVAVYESCHVTHHLLLTTHGDAGIVLGSRGLEADFATSTGQLSYFPADQQSHSMTITTLGGYAGFDVLIPDQQVQGVCSSEGIQGAESFRARPLFRDELMRASLMRLSATTVGGGILGDIGDEIAARHIVLRLCAAVGGTLPDWRHDSSVFTPVVMRGLVGFIDASLGLGMSLESISGTVGLSPGHFARKFSHSAGESLNRFVNRRRIGTSFAMLSGGNQSLAGIALRLGFSSQSHFSRLFSGLTGITPLQFRRQHRRIVVEG
jgi:AraC-like DNA-binding protein